MKRQARGLLIVTAALALVFAGCSDDDAAQTTTSTSATDATTSTTATTVTSTASTEPAKAPGDTGSGDYLFRSPSDNIACSLTGVEARCDITDRSFTPPPKPADCDLDWGDVVHVAAKRGAFVCAGDTVRDEAAPVLPYGAEVRRGDLRCRSDQAGIRCENTSTNHFFVISRARYELG